MLTLEHRSGQSTAAFVRCDELPTPTDYQWRLSASAIKPHVCISCRTICSVSLSHCSCIAGVQARLVVTPVTKGFVFGAAHVYYISVFSSTSSPLEFSAHAKHVIPLGLSFDPEFCLTASAQLGNDDQVAEQTAVQCAIDELKGTHAMLSQYNHSRRPSKSTVDDESASRDPSRPPTSSAVPRVQTPLAVQVPTLPMALPRVPGFLMSPMQRAAATGVDSDETQSGGTRSMLLQVSGSTLVSPSLRMRAAVETSTPQVVHYHLRGKGAEEPVASATLLSPQASVYSMRSLRSVPSMMTASSDASKATSIASGGTASTSRRRHHRAGLADAAKIRTERLINAIIGK